MTTLAFSDDTGHHVQPVSPPRILALDLSLRSTGWCDGEQANTTEFKASRGISRLRGIRDVVLALVRGRYRLDFACSAWNANLVVIEGYAFSAHASHAHELGELGGVIRVALADHGIPFVDIPPASLKLFATGKGNANKEAMLAAAIRKLEYAGHSNDEVDALWLWHMANLYYNGPQPNVHQAKALLKIQWPTLTPLGADPHAE